MAETKKEKPAAKKTASKAATAEEKAKATGKRIGAVIFWVLAIACEILGILSYFGKVNITFIPTLAFIIGVIVLDLIFVIIGSQLWKNANHLDPISEKNKVKFFLWNNMGLIVACFAFIPYLILLIRDKDKLDKKTKTVAIIAAAVALLIGGLTSVDWNPVSEESKAEAIETITDDVYWTTFGKVYHIDEDCQHINGKDNIDHGSVQDAIDSNRTRLCKTCADRHGIDIEDVEN